MLFNKTNKNNISSVLDVANYFLRQDRPDERWRVTNFKLQSLVYYAQGWSLSLRDKPIFYNKLEAAPLGVICPDLYRMYSKYSFKEVIPQTHTNLSILTEDDEDLLAAIWSKYGNSTTKQLRFMIYNEAPWRNAWAAAKAGNGRLITDDCLRSYFNSLFESG